jgi:hypothetical protein
MNISLSNRWPAALVIFYTLFIIVTLSIVVFSTFQRIDLVAEDYYEREIRYQQQIERMQRADSLSAPVSWNYNRTEKSVTVRFPLEVTAREIKGNLLFFRPSDARHDRVISLQLSGGNSQTVSTTQLLPGLWKIKIFWEFNQKEYYTEGLLII